MNTNEIIQQKKNEALNKIRKIFNPLVKNHYDNHSDESYSEQREYEIRYIIETLEKELKILKIKNYSNEI